MSKIIEMRKFKDNGEVMAFFPDEEFEPGKYKCYFAGKGGGMGLARKDFVFNGNTVVAKESEHSPLLAEMQNKYPTYDFQVVNQL